MTPEITSKALHCGQVILAIMFIAGCSASDSLAPADAIIHNVRIVDVAEGRVIAGKAIVVIDGIISDVINEDSIQKYEPNKTIDGDGYFLIPALADVHVHIQSRSELQNFVRYGVGLVVNMSGGPQHLEMRKAVASGDILGPSIVSVGPTLDGDPPTNPLFTTINPENADEVIDWIDRKGYDAVKVYQQMDADTLGAAILAARTRGLITTGHVSREIGIEQTLNAGQRYIAHGEELAFESFDETSRTYDMGAVSGLADRLAEAGITLTPMLAYLENIPRQVGGLQTYLDSKEMRLVPAAMRMSFDQSQGWYANRQDPNGFIDQISSLADFVKLLSAALHERGVPLVLGTDAGFGGAIPGYSVHEELGALVDAGLTEIAALRTATLEVGEYLKQIDPARSPWGLVSPGYTASVVLIGANPIEDIAATQDIRGVMIDGNWIDEDDLTGLEDALSRRQQAMLPLARAFEDAIVAGDPDSAGAAIESIPAEMAGEPLISADNCIFLGYRHYYGGNRPLAGQLYELCATMQPNSSPLWIHIARAYESERRTEAALRAYRLALVLNPWYGDPRSAINGLNLDAPQGETKGR
jgi:hypothetical protein